MPFYDSMDSEFELSEKWGKNLTFELCMSPSDSELTISQIIRHPLKNIGNHCRDYSDGSMYDFKSKILQ